MKKILTISTALLALLTACQPTVKETGPIKIGFIAPLTGEAAAYGSDTLGGVKLKIAEVNAAGGIGGRLVELIAEDGRCTGSDAASAAQKLIHVNNVVAIIGGACSGEVLALAPIAEAAHIPVISPTASSPDVTQAGDYIFRDYPSDALKTIAMKQYFVAQGFTRIATIAENTDFAVAFRDALKSQIGSDALVFSETVEPGTKDFRSLLTRLKNVDFDVFFTNTNSVPVMAAMLQQLRELGFTQQIITHDVGDSITLVETAPAATEGMHIINIPNAGEGSDFETRFVREFGIPKQGMAFVAHAYDAAGVLLKAIASAGTDGAAIRAALAQETGYEGVVGTFRFDDNGDVLGIGYVLKKVQNGRIVEVEPITLN